MRSDDDVVHPEQRRVGRGLDGEDVESRAREVAVVERLGECVLVDDATSGSVHEASPGLHHPELLRSDQSLRLRRPRQVDRHEVRLDQERLERRHDLDAHLLRAIDAHVRIERDHPHPERCSPSGDQ